MREDEKHLIWRLKTQVGLTEKEAEKRVERMKEWLKKKKKA